ALDELLAALAELLAVQEGLQLDLVLAGHQEGIERGPGRQGRGVVGMVHDRLRARQRSATGRSGAQYLRPRAAVVFLAGTAAGAPFPFTTAGLPRAGLPRGSGASRTSREYGAASTVC